MADDGGETGTGAGTTGGDVYDWWSRHPGALEALYALAFLGRESTFRRRALAALDLDGGERVLEVGCGNGNGLGPLRAGAGPDGRVVGLDASRGMVRAARNRVREAGWETVDVVRGDARRPPVADGAFDAAYAAMSLTAVPDPGRAVAATHDALGPGGRFVVLDARPFRGWPWRALNPVIVPLAERATNWVPEVDLVAALRRTFASVDVAASHGGSIVVARACKADE